MNRNQSLHIRLRSDSDEQVEIADVSVDVIFLMQGRERYSFHAGTTDAHGELSAAYEVFETARKAEASLSIMDYNDGLEECDSTIRIRIPSIEELRRRADAVKKFYPEDARPVLTRLEKSGNAEIAAEPLPIRLKSEGVTQIDVPVQLKVR